MPVSHHLKWKEKRSRKQAREMVMMMAMYSDNLINTQRKVPLASEEEVLGLFKANGYDFDQVVEECRERESAVPLVENILGSVWYMSGDEGVEAVITSNYQASFEAAVDHLDRAVSNWTFGDIESAIVRGISSVESFILYQTELWNELNQDDKLVDNRDNKVPMDDKFDLWVPKMTGHQIDKGTRNWQDFRRLRGIRDNLTVHPKSQHHSVTFQEMADLINVFRTGVAGFLIDLHLVFRNFIPGHIISARYATDVEVVQASGGTKQ
jgi:hypothetical protein